MESLQGGRALEIDAQALAVCLAGYTDVLIDLGTGDGRFVRHVAASCPTTFAIGIDACRENLRRQTRRMPPNALYLIANALALPAPLDGLATRLTVNFPWGSLLEALVAGDPAVVERLAALTCPGALVEVRLNAGALAEIGWPLAEGGQRVRRALQAGGFRVRPAIELGPAELRACPTTWARRLAFGRDPRALELRGERAPRFSDASSGFAGLLPQAGNGLAHHADQPRIVVGVADIPARHADGVARAATRRAE